MVGFLMRMEKALTHVDIHNSYKGLALVSIRNTHTTVQLSCCAWSVQQAGSVKLHLRT